MHMNANLTARLSDRAARNILACLVALLSVAACTPASPSEEMSPEEEACEHGEAGPFIDVTATTTGSDAPDVSEEHTAHRVTLPSPAEGATEREGHVRFASSEEGEILVFMGDEVSLTVYDSAGSEVSAEFTGEPVDTCEVLAVHAAYPVMVGSYDLVIGPTSLETVLLVIEHGSSHEHADDHDHTEE